LEAEDRAKRDNADQALNTIKLQVDDLAEVDFTVQGKVGSCGNCSLGGMSFSCSHLLQWLIFVQMLSDAMDVRILDFLLSNLGKRSVF